MKIRYVIFVFVVVIATNLSQGYVRVGEVIPSTQYAGEQSPRTLPVVLNTEQPQDIVCSTPKPFIPERIQIPSINIDATIIPVGLSKGIMQVPKDWDTVGWLNTQGFNVGDNGYSVMAGHYDSKTGKAVFYDLKRLHSQDEVIILGTDGSKRIFLVISYIIMEAVYDPNKFSIFGKSDTSNLNLITCAGTFNQTTHHYDKRLVVFTKLKE